MVVYELELDDGLRDGENGCVEWNMLMGVNGFGNDRGCVMLGDIVFGCENGIGLWGICEMYRGVGRIGLVVRDPDWSMHCFSDLLFLSDVGCIDRVSCIDPVSVVSVLGSFGMNLSLMSTRKSFSEF